MAGELAEIRRQYNVPAFRGARIVYMTESGPVECIILSGRNAHLRVRPVGECNRWLLHPTWRVKYEAQAKS